MKLDSGEHDRNIQENEDQHEVAILYGEGRGLKQSQGGEGVEIENSPVWTVQDHEMDHDICPTNPASSSNAVQYRGTAGK